MNPAELQELRRRLYAEFNPDAPVPADDPRYVECDEERGSAALIDAFAESIRLSEKPKGCHLFSGHRGCGKTSDLKRLQKRLESRLPLIGEPEYFVVYCELDALVDMNGPVEFSDVLLAVTHQIWETADAKGISCQPTDFEALLDDLQDIVGRFTAKQVHVGDKIKLVLDMKGPGPRQQVREKLRSQATKLTEAVNEVIKNVRAALSARGSKGPVVIVDNLDRMPRTPLPNGATTHERLFIDSAGFLSGIDCHVIYTVPPAVLLSLRGANLHLRYGSDPAVRMPMIPVTDRRGVRHEAGAAKLREFLEKRIRCATDQRLGTDDVFAPGVADDLCRLSGGFPRQLIGMARAAVRRAKTSSIGADVLKEVFREWRDAMTVAINPEQWSVLRKLRHSERKELGVGDENCLSLLENLVILEYRDDQGFWYDVDPVLWNNPELQRSEPYEKPEAD
jgi:hypothetical protein